MLQALCACNISVWNEECTSGMLSLRSDCALRYQFKGAIAECYDDSENSYKKPQVSDR
jgi:hypothetical protein